jgi:phosphopantetheine adenylyltransferase
VVHGYIWRYAKKQDASIFFRGIRSWQKDGAEERSLQILNTWGPLLLGPLYWPIPTVYLEGNPEFNHVSSTLVRDICGDAGDSSTALSSLVPASISDEVARLYGKK